MGESGRSICVLIECFRLSHFIPILKIHRPACVVCTTCWLQFHSRVVCVSILMLILSLYLPFVSNFLRFHSEHFGRLGPILICRMSLCCDV